MTARAWGWINRMHAATSKVVRRVLGDNGVWKYHRNSIPGLHLWVGYSGGNFEMFSTKMPPGPAAMVDLHRQANDWLERECTKQLIAEETGRKHKPRFTFNRKGER